MKILGLNAATLVILIVIIVLAILIVRRIVKRKGGCECSGECCSRECCGSDNKPKFAGIIEGNDAVAGDSENAGGVGKTGEDMAKGAGTSAVVADSDQDGGRVVTTTDEVK